MSTRSPGARPRVARRSRRARVGAALLGIAALGLACAAGGADPARVATPSPSAPLSDAALGELTYPGALPDAPPVHLRGGRYAGAPYTAGAATAPRVRLVPELVARGDLDGDGSEDAAVLLEVDTGGSGVQVRVAAVLGGLAPPHVTEARAVGDRVRVRSLVIEPDRVVAEAVVAGPDDPMCCPAQLERLTWRLADGELDAPEVLRLGRLSPAVLDGTSWRLVDLGDGAPLPPDVEPTARFEAGRIAGSGGCNHYTASLTGGRTPTAIAIGPIASTRRMCPEPWMQVEGRFLTALGEARRFDFAYGRLLLVCGGAAGPERVLRFEPEATLH